MHKQYIIPTQKWLKPLIPLIENELDHTGLLLLSERIGKDQVIVKITKGHNIMIQKINELIYNEPNCIKTYNTILCYEDRKQINHKYKNSDGFCNSNKDIGTKITLEVMKKYESSLNKYNKKISMKYYIEIIKQLLYAQLHLFSKYGLMHNDIHEGNILVKNKLDKEKEITYKIDDEIQTLKIKFEVVLSDFEKAITYNKNITDTFDKYYIWTADNKINLENCDYTITLAKNLIDTITFTVHLLKKEDYDKHGDRIINNINIKKCKYIIDFCQSDTRTLFKKERHYEGYHERLLTKGKLLTKYIISVLEENDNWLTF